MGNWIRDEPSRVGWSLLAHEMGERRAQIDARRTSPPARPPLPRKPFRVIAAPRRLRRRARRARNLAGAVEEVHAVDMSVGHVASTIEELAAGATAGEAARVSNVQALTLAGGVTPTTTLDITNNGLVVDYATAGAEPFNTIRAQILSGRAGGTWTGAGIGRSPAVQAPTGQHQDS